MFEQLLRKTVRELEIKSILHTVRVQYGMYVAIMLFKVEAAVRLGAIKPSSTSMLACWNVWLQNNISA